MSFSMKYNLCFNLIFVNIPLDGHIYKLIPTEYEKLKIGKLVEGKRTLMTTVLQFFERIVGNFLINDLKKQKRHSECTRLFLLYNTATPTA